MKDDPDINDTMANEGEDAARKRHDSAERFVRFKLIPFAQLQPTTKPNYLIKGLIPRTGLVVVWGPPKCGKSFWTFDLVMHIALGWQYRGRRTRQGAAVYCAFEGADGFKARVEAFRREHGVTDAPFFLVPAVVNLIKDHAGLIASIRAQCPTPAAVTLDTLNRSLFGSESNDQDMANYVKAADAIREAFGCVVIIVHHCGVAGDRPRGHTSLTGACDAQLAVKRDGESNVVVQVEHMKDGPEGAVIGSRLDRVELGVDDDGDPIASCIVVPADNVYSHAKRRPVGAAKVAYDLLVRAIVDEGQTVSSNHVPAQKKVVRINLWRGYCYAGQISEGDNPDANKKAFARAVEKLQELELVGVWNEWAWIA